jgi:hypothetical protein
MEYLHTVILTQTTCLITFNRKLLSPGLRVFLNLVIKHGFLNALFECHVPTISARSTCIKTIKTEEIGWLLISKYGISTNRWHQVSHADIQRRKNRLKTKLHGS